MIYSGIDWSGDPGDPAKSALSPRFVAAIAHIDGEHLHLLEESLINVRAAKRLPERFAFRYSHCASQVKDAFFTAIGGVPVTFHASIHDKRNWPSSRFRERGPDIINQILADLVCGCPPEVIASQVILVDQPRQETRAVRQTSATIKMALRGIGVAPAPQIKPCPDNRSQGGIIQVADMFAGALNQMNAVQGSYLDPHAARITLI
jgi:hypothetical protein